MPLLTNSIQANDKQQTRKDNILKNKGPLDQSVLLRVCTFKRFRATQPPEDNRPIGCTSPLPQMCHQRAELILFRHKSTCFFFHYDPLWFLNFAHALSQTSSLC